MSTLIPPVAPTNQQASYCRWLKGCLALGIAAVTVATVVVVVVAMVENASGWTDSSVEIRSIHDDIGLEIKEKLFKEVKKDGKNLSLSLPLI